MVALRKENIKLKGRIFELEKEQRELVEGAMLIKTNGVRHRQFKIIESFFLANPGPSQHMSRS